MKWEVCGLEYGLSNNCSGISPFPDEMAPPSGLWFAYPGQMSRWLILIPIVGRLLVGLGSVAAMMVFEEVDEVERMKAFGLAATRGILFWIASIWIATNGPRPMQ